MLSQSAVHVQSVAHAARTTVATTAVHVVMTTEDHVAMTEAQEVHVVSVLLKLQSRTTSRRCSNLQNINEKG
jgi:hypothetical protein